MSQLSIFNIFFMLNIEYLQIKIRFNLFWDINDMIEKWRRNMAEKQHIQIDTQSNSNQFFFYFYNIIPDSGGVRPPPISEPKFSRPGQMSPMPLPKYGPGNKWVLYLLSNYVIIRNILSDDTVSNYRRTYPLIYLCFIPNQNNI